MKLKKLAELPSTAELLLLVNEDESGPHLLPVRLVSIEDGRARVTNGRIRREHPDGSIMVEPGRLARDWETEELMDTSRHDAAEAAAFFRDLREERERLGTWGPDE